MKRKILRLVKRLKDQLKDLKYKEHDPYEGLRILDSFNKTRYTTFTNSVEDYLAGKTIFKRKVMILIMNLAIWIFVIRCSFMVFLGKNPTMIWLTGDFSYLYPRSDILNLAVALLYLSNALCGKLSHKSKY
jgi:hypothetical protein